MDNRVTTNRKIIKYDGQSFLEIEEEIVNEFPLTIILNGEEFATMLCTPTDIKDLVFGFLGSEGVIRFSEDIQSVSFNEQNGFAYVELKNKQSVSKEYYSKRFLGSCCGKSRQFYFYNDAKTAKTVNTRMKLSTSRCLNLMNNLQQYSVYFQKTGGVHNAALCNADEILIYRTDIGRHNTLDKIYGYCIQNKIPLGDKLIVFSGRISSEVLLKTAKIGIGILLSKSPPTDLSIQLADDLGITIVGFIRENKMNIYTHPERIIDDTFQNEL